jgi:hypothetical protein
MPVSTEAVGKRYPPVVYAVGREKVKEYAFRVGETDPLHLDVEAALGRPATRDWSRRPAFRRRLLRPPPPPPRGAAGASSDPLERRASTSARRSLAARRSTWGPVLSVVMAG